MNTEDKELYEKLFDVGKKIGLPIGYCIAWEPIAHNKILLEILRALVRETATKEDIRNYLRLAESLAVRSKKCLENSIDMFSLRETNKEE
jgi:hypothetical protein